MLVVGIPKAAERLLRLARITVAQDDQPAGRDLLGQCGVTLNGGTRYALKQHAERLEDRFRSAQRLNPKLWTQRPRDLRSSPRAVARGRRP